MNGILTASDAAAVYAVIDAAAGGKKVARADDDGNVTYGTARSLCGDATGGFLGGRDDVRDCYLHVTLTTGFEAFWPVRELMPMVMSGMFVVGYER